MTIFQRARVAGILYLVVGIFGGFAVGYVAPLGAQAGADLVRWGVAADFVQLVAFLGLASLLKAVLEGRDSAWGTLLVASVTASVALMAAGDAAALAGAWELKAGLLLSAQVFFGFWLVPLAVLGWRSGRFPRWLCLLLAAGAAAYGADGTLTLLAPPWGASAHGWLGLVPAAAEIAAVLYLLIVGVKKKESDPQA